MNAISSAVTAIGATVTAIDTKVSDLVFRQVAFVYTLASWPVLTTPALRAQDGVSYYECAVTSAPTPGVGGFDGAEVSIVLYGAVGATGTTARVPPGATIVVQGAADPTGERRGHCEITVLNSKSKNNVRASLSVLSIADNSVMAAVAAQ